MFCYSSVIILVQTDWNKQPTNDKQPTNYRRLVSIYNLQFHLETVDLDVCIGVVMFLPGM